ncbi:glutaminyl cyclase [Trypanosoma grayi]|uniref:glutaminyl cyclase n=1 Tax=Trypanosoma grayi TaxID=71804 RepID=UPI0004F45073|nr:glutaminyl cyclase [Trypanosoma grayi]KEG08813.1 glutaminyl cyclase [Trypanosoma grayi]
MRRGASRPSTRGPSNSNGGSTPMKGRRGRGRLLRRGVMLTITVAVCLVVATWFWPQQKQKQPQGDVHIEDAALVVEGPWGRATRRPPYAQLQPRTQLTLQPTKDRDATAGDAQSSNVADVLSSLAVLLPPTQHHEAIMRKINRVLSFGTRVAGSFSPGHRKMLEFLVAEGQWLPPREALFSTAAVAEFPAFYWELEWDNFTSATPLGERQFSNVVFHFNGGSAFRQRSKDKAGTRKEKLSKQRPSFAAAGGRKLAGEQLEHVVLAAHWDSKHYTGFDFLGACDSAVPVVYLLETMRLIAVLADTAAVMTAAAEASKAVESGDVCRRLRDALSPAYRAVLRYHYADDAETINCLHGGSAGDGREWVRNASSGVHGGEWLRLLHLVMHLPAITVVFFDGEEAFVEWRGTDHTYGSRHLAQRWKAARSWSATAAAEDAPSRFDFIDLFVLYDLMGTPGTQFHNYFPDQSGMAFALLAEVEQSHRVRAERLLRLELQAREEGRTCTPHLPELWCRHGPPHDMYTLYGLARVFGPLQHRTDLAQLWVPPTPGGSSSSSSNNNNIFFPFWQKSAQGPTLQASFGVEDDHIHWMETQRVLHVIPLPFPPSWHTARDDGSELDGGTIVDLFRVLVEFTLRLGEGWWANTGADRRKHDMG